MKEKLHQLLSTADKLDNDVNKVMVMAAALGLVGEMATKGVQVPEDVFVGLTNEQRAFAVMCICTGLLAILQE